MRGRLGVCAGPGNQKTVDIVFSLVGRQEKGFGRGVTGSYSCFSEVFSVSE